MDKAARIRWAVLLCALVATVAAIVYPDDKRIERPGFRPAKAKASTPNVPAPREDERGRKIWIASDEDPFAPRAWVLPPPPAPPSQSPVSFAQAPAAPMVVAEQQLPYRFLGQMQDGDTRVLYLGHGEQVVLAHLGDVLEGSYKVVAIGDSQVEFESVQSGNRQTLPIPAQ